jgi:hypothetical protein
MTYGFPDSVISELKTQHPEIDVDYEAKNALNMILEGKVRHPEAFLRAACTSPRAQKLAQASPMPVVWSFNPDGSCFPAGPHLADPLTRFVDGCVTARKRGYPPDRIAQGILDTHPDWLEAFPNIKTWLTARDWPSCPTSTSAEQAIKDGGLGAGGCFILDQRLAQSPSLPPSVQALPLSPPHPSTESNQTSIDLPARS